jgi:hypothetical protein
MCRGVGMEFPHLLAVDIEQPAIFDEQRFALQGFPNGRSHQNRITRFGKELVNCTAVDGIHQVTKKQANQVVTKDTPYKTNETSAHQQPETTAVFKPAPKQVDHKR